MLERITPLILTFNEEVNLPRTLARLSWAKRIVVLDSLSTDHTQEIAEAHPQVELARRAFDRHADQWNHGLSLVDTEWVLSLDADYLVTHELVEAIHALPRDPSCQGYAAGIRYCVFGRPLRGSLYPNRVVLFRPDCGHYEQDGHTQRLQIDGEVGRLDGTIDHDDRKPLSRWLRNQERYAELEAEKLLTTPRDRLGWVDRLRRTGWLVPLLMPGYTLLAKGLLLDGRAGLHYTMQRTYAEFCLALKLLGRRLGRRTEGAPVSLPKAVLREEAELSKPRPRL